jgi:segregation and condensation protein B
MDDLEDELASVAGLDAPAPAPEPAPEPTQEPVVEAPVESEHARTAGVHPSPHSGWGTEPDGGTEVT